MRTYGKRFMRQERARETRNSRETKNAIVWSIDATNRKANVRIQKSNTTISAYFPTSWYSMPEWVKVGAPVRIVFTGGHHGRIELLGPGTVIPYPQTGNVWPDAPVRANHIQSGLQVSPIPNRKRMAYMVKPGSVVINNTDVTVPEIAMGSTDNYLMGDGGYMGNVAAVRSVSAPSVGSYPAHGWYIYNVFANSAGAITHSAGEAFKTSKPYWPAEEIQNLAGTVYDWEDWVFPTRFSPATPELSLLIGSVVTWEDMTGVEATNIDWIWRACPHSIYSREPVILFDDDPAANEIDWGNNTCTIKIVAHDNRGLYWKVNNEYWIEATIVHGTGGVRDALAYGIPEEDRTYGTSCKCVNLAAGLPTKFYPEWYIQYQRDNLVTDVSPQIECKLLINNELITYTGVILYDAGGDVML